MQRKTPWGVRLGSAIVRLLLGVVLALVAAIFYLQVHGIPGWGVARLMARVSTPDLSLEADAVRLTMFHGLRATSVRVCRKRVVGPPMVSAERVDLLIDPLALFAGKSMALRRVRVVDGWLRPEMTAQQTAARAARETREDGGADRVPPGETRARRVVVELIDCRYHGVNIEHLECELTVRGSDWSADELEATLAEGGRRGTVSGGVAYSRAEGWVKGHLATRMNPAILLPCFEAWQMPGTADLVRRFDFGSSVPRCEATFIRRLSPDNSFESNGRLWIESSSYRGVPVERADADVRIRIERGHLFLTVDPVFITRTEGRCRAGFTYDGERDNVVFDGDSALEPNALLGLIGILTHGELAMFDVAGGFHARGGGLVALGDRAKSDFKVSVKCGRIGWKKLVAEDCSFYVKMEGTTITVDGFEGDLCGGKLAGDAALYFDPVSFTNTGYKVEANIVDAQCARLVRLETTAPHELRGKLSGSVTVSGPPGSDILGTMTGSGKVGIQDGRVFSLPLFGGFSRIMTKVIPGLDFVLRQSDANAPFTIADGKMHADEIDIKGDVLSLTGSGDYHFDGTLDFSARVSLMKEHTLVAKVLAPLVYPISKLFEFRLRGTLADPDWYPVNFSRDMLQKIGLVQKNESAD